MFQTFGICLNCISFQILLIAPNLKKFSFVIWVEMYVSFKKIWLSLLLVFIFASFSRLMVWKPISDFCLLQFFFCFVLFFYQGFLSRTLATHSIAGEGRGPSFIPLYQFHPLTNIQTFICRHLNPFVPNVLFLYALKTSENHKVFWCFQEAEKGCIRNKMG